MKADPILLLVLITTTLLIASCGESPRDSEAKVSSTSSDGSYSIDKKRRVDKFDEANTCAISDITIDKTNVKVDMDMLRIVGRVINNCSDSTGVQLKIVLYDTEGNIQKVQDMWPASINNIPPHSNFPFEFLTKQIDGFEKMEMRVIDVKKW